MLNSFGRAFWNELHFFYISRGLRLLTSKRDTVITVTNYTMSISVRLRQFIKEIHILATDSAKHRANLCDKTQLDSLLVEVAHLLKISTQVTHTCIFHDDELEEARIEFISVHYANVLDCLISTFTVEWVTSLNTHMRKVLDDIFLKGPAKDTLMRLCTSITDSNPGYKVNKCVSILERFILQHGICTLLLEQCTTVHNSQTPVQCKNAWDEISTAITSLPERVTSKLRHETSDIFFPQSYYPFVIKDILSCTKQVHSDLRNGKDGCIGILSVLLGKLCITGHADVVWPLLLKEWIPEITKDAVWRRMVNKLILDLPDRYMEATIGPFLKHCQWYGTVQIFLGHSVLENRKLRFLLTTKLLLMRYSQEDIVPQNIMGYLASLDILQPTFISLIKKLLEVWGDNSAIKHSSYEQHLYLSKAIVISMAFIRQKESLRTELKDAMLPLLMPGVQHHLASSVDKVRKLGMIVAEQVTLTANPSPDNVLKFEYEKDDDTIRLESLCNVPEDPGMEQFCVSIDESLNIKSEVGSAAERTENMCMTCKDSDSELDSDDDLEPYDMSHDVKRGSVKPPMYVRECMEDIISNEEPEKVEISLECAERLIRAHPTNGREIAVEFCKVLIRLDNKYCIVGYLSRRHNTMVALCVISPVPVSEYLTQQFYERNYNIRQRMDMLEVLASAAQEISGLKQTLSQDTAPQSKISVLEDVTPEGEEAGGQ